jgi:hypothetical protein
MHVEGVPLLPFLQLKHIAVLDLFDCVRSDQIRLINTKPRQQRAFEPSQTHTQATDPRMNSDTKRFGQRKCT